MGSRISSLLFDCIFGGGKSVIRGFEAWMKLVGRFWLKEVL